MDNVAKLLLARRKMELIVNQLNLARWGRILQDVRGSIHGFANEEDEAFLRHQIESATTSISSLEKVIEQLENTPEPEKVLDFPRTMQGRAGTATQVLLLSQAGFEIRWYD